MMSSICPHGVRRSAPGVGPEAWGSIACKAPPTTHPVCSTENFTSPCQFLTVGVSSLRPRLPDHLTNNHIERRGSAMIAIISYLEYAIGEHQKSKIFKLDRPSRRLQILDFFFSPRCRNSPEL